MKNKPSKDFIKEFTRKNKLPIFFLVLRALLDTVASIGVAWILMQILNLLSGVEIGFDLLTLVYIGLGGLALIFLIYLIEYNSKPKFTARALKQYTNFSFNKLTNKSVSAFTKEKSSLYISALSNDISVIETNYITSLIEVFQFSLICLASIIMMIYYSPLLTLISIILAFLPIAASLITGNKAVYWQKRYLMKMKNIFLHYRIQ